MRGEHLTFPSRNNPHHFMNCNRVHSRTNTCPVIADETGFRTLFLTCSFFPNTSMTSSVSQTGDPAAHPGELKRSAKVVCLNRCRSESHVCRTNSVTGRCGYFYKYSLSHYQQHTLTGDPGSEKLLSLFLTVIFIAMILVAGCRRD